MSETTINPPKTVTCYGCNTSTERYEERVTRERVNSYGGGYSYETKWVKYCQKCIELLYS